MADRRLKRQIATKEKRNFKIEEEMQKIQGNMEDNKTNF